MDDLQKKLEAIAGKTDDSYHALNLRLYQQIAYAALGEGGAEEARAEAITRMYEDYVEDATNERSIDDAITDLINGDSGSSITASAGGSARRELLAAARDGASPSTLIATARSHSGGTSTLAALADEMGTDAYGPGTSTGGSGDGTATRLVRANEQLDRSQRHKERREIRASEASENSLDDYGPGVAGWTDPRSKSKDEMVREIRAKDSSMAEMTHDQLMDEPDRIIQKTHAKLTGSSTSSASQNDNPALDEFGTGVGGL